ncbi:hypothetical protein LXM60_16910 [Pandoraea sputorum]|uniref:hypothetical protein n=1 Tax=Pandoraea sputorum TaxID=93222 RepID=UPI001E3B5DC7|nr:hypothetical protein [Pandoraea sputorum]MCE4061882.1 hypothetical protein [Pandoraea sputorum]
MNARDPAPQLISSRPPGASFLVPPSVAEAVGNLLDPAATAPNGATVVVPVYDEQQAGDTVRIDWTGKAADGSPVTYYDDRLVFGGDVGQQMSFTVPQMIVEATAGGTVDITFMVKFFWETGSASSETRQQTSVPLSLRVLAASAPIQAPSVDRVNAGMLDPDADPGGTVARVPPGVTQAGDVVHMYWVGATTYTDWFPVNGGTAGQELPFEIARALIDENRNRQVAVHYEIMRGGAMLKSDALRFTVGEVQGLPAPELPDAVGDVLDPGSVVGDVQIVAPAEADLEPGDLVTVYVTGPKGSNSASRLVPGSGTGQSLSVAVPVKVFQDNVGEDVEVHYTVTRFIDGREDRSDTRTIQVRAGATTFPAPTIREATGNELNPIDAAHLLTAIIDYTGSQPTDEVQVTWTGKDEYSSYTTPWVVIGGLPRQIPLEPSIVPLNLGQTVAVTYEVRRAGVTAGRSDVLQLHVQALDTSPGGPLPTPQLKDIEGDELDLDLVANGGTITVTPPWPLIAEGQRFWLDLQGTDSEGNVHNYRQANGVLVNAQHVETGLPNRQVPASYFEPLADGSLLTIIFKVTFDGSSNEADAVVFPVRTYAVGRIPSTLIEDFESADRVNMPVNSTVHLAFMSITNLYGVVTIWDVAGGPGVPVTGRVLTCGDYAQAQLEFNFPIRRLRFAFSTASSKNVQFYDENMNLVHSASTPLLGGAYYGWMDYSHPTAVIKYVRLIGGTLMQIDNVQVET